MIEEDKFIDPPNVNEIIERVKKCPTMKDINDLLYEIYPKWIVLYLERYSDDYPQLQNNWEFITSKHNIKKCQMVIVQKMINDDSHKLIQLFAEIYSLSGFIVRSKDEIIPCEKCFSAIPNIETYEKMKNEGLPVPERWLRVCQNCLPLLIKENEQREANKKKAEEEKNF